MRVLVLGGAGFIGSHIVRRILRDSPEADIVVVDSLWTGLEENIANLPGVRLVRSPVEECDWRGLGSFHQVYHLASPASPMWYSPQPTKTIMANVMGAHLAVQCVVPGGRVMFTSTSEVYGDPQVSPQPESYLGLVKSCGPRGAYDEGKRCAEALLWNEHRLAAERGDSFELKIARIFNCYGPHTRPDDGRAVSNFLTAAMRGEDLVVYGDGSQTRCFGHVDDIVDGLGCLFHETPSEFVGPLNIGLDEEISVLELARYIADDLFGGTVGIRHADPTPDDPQQRRPDLTLCRATIPQWTPSVGWRQGVYDTLRWFQMKGEN